MRFNLRDKKSNSQTAIQMVVNYENTRVKIPTGLSIPPSLWLDKKQRAKGTMDFQDGIRINDKLDEMEAVMSSLLNSTLLSSIMTNLCALKYLRVSRL